MPALFSLAARGSNRHPMLQRGTSGAARTAEAGLEARHPCSAPRQTRKYTIHGSGADWNPSDPISGLGDSHTHSGRGELKPIHGEIALCAPTIRPGCCPYRCTL